MVPSAPRRLFAAGLLALPLLFSAPARANAPGDVDGDGAVTIKDVLLALRASVHLVTLSPAAFAAADVAPRPGTKFRLFGDDKIDLADVTRLLQYVVNLLPDSEFIPSEPQALYTLDAGPKCNGPASVTVVDLPKFTVSSAGAVTPGAFAAGSIPNAFVTRGGTGYLVNSGSDSVQVIDLATNKTTATISLGKGSNPMDIALVGDRAYVTLLIPGTVALLDLKSNTVAGSTSVGAGPTGIVAAQGKLYVANSAFLGYDAASMSSKYGPGTVSVIDPNAGKVIASLAVPTNPQQLTMDRRGRIHVLSTGDFGATPGFVSVIDPATDTLVGTVPIGGSPSFLAITDGDRAYLSDTAGLTEYDARTLKVIRGPSNEIPLNPGPWALATDHRGRLFVSVLSANKVSVLDPYTDQFVSDIATGACPEGLAVRQ